MSANEIHVADVGTVITATLKDGASSIDLSGITTKYFLLHKPDGTNTTITANFVGSGTSGAITFTSTATHFDTEGSYQLQVFVSDATNQWHTDVYRFLVYPNLG